MYNSAHMGFRLVAMRARVPAVPARPQAPSGCLRAGHEIAGAPRSMKMGTILSPFPYDAAGRNALQSPNLRWPAILHYAS
jgi:hypothetical protein